MTVEYGPKLNYYKVFKSLVNQTYQYVTKHNIKSMVLGISGGIDSTVCAAICYEVNKITGIPLIGLSLPVKYAKEDIILCEQIGKAFCSDFKALNIKEMYKSLLSSSCSRTSFIGNPEHYLLEKLERLNERNPIINGNLQARSRMIHLYDEASLNKGIVIDTCNQTEYQLGFWTLHGDVGDFCPLRDLWKTEVYELAEWISETYNFIGSYLNDTNKGQLFFNKSEALKKSSLLEPTGGLGNGTDLEQIGAKSYADVDDILRSLLMFDKTESDGDFIAYSLQQEYVIKKYGKEVVDNVWGRHINTHFKRKPIHVIERFNYEN